MEVILTAIVTAAVVFLGVWIFMRRRYILFTEKVCRSVDAVAEGRGGEMLETDRETLLSKVQMKLKRLDEITAKAAEENARQKCEVQKTVSDISHQLKTPVANVVMYCDTVMNPSLPAREKERCMAVLKGQVEKLDFLVKSLIHMSRLEQNIISMKPERISLKSLMESAVCGIAAAAEKRAVRIECACENDKFLWCDEKWTLEALLNVLDNAVKYSPENSTVKISSESMEIYTRISVADSGAGISPEHINDVYRRFYREDRVSRTEGLGIGLYLTREILKQEKGYIKIRSEENRGTTVSVYLLNALFKYT